MFLDQGAELKRDAVSGDELHVRDVLSRCCCGLNAQGVTRFEHFGDLEKSLSTKILYVEWCVVTFKEHLLIKMVAGQQAGQTLGHA